MKSYKFSTAKLDVVQYREPLGKGSATKLNLDETLCGLVNKYGLHRMVFEGTNGFYLCVPAVSDNFVSNPFNLDVEAISNISKLLEGAIEDFDLSLLGWSMFESEPNECVIRLHVCDREYDTADGEVPNIVFDMSTFKVRNQHSLSFYGVSVVNQIINNVRGVLHSLSVFNLPLHLLEVSQFGAKYSEESYDEDDDETCVWTEMGSFSNVNHVVEGLSIITKANGFELEGHLEGKYAMVVVV